MRPEVFALALASTAIAGAVACGGGTAVSSTTSSHKRPDHAPPAPDLAASDVSGTAPVPAIDDPDERLAFVRAGAIWIMGADGADPRRLTSRPPGGDDGTPALSPRGDAVAFGSQRDGAAKIWVTGLDGSGTQAVTDGADGGDRQPAWSPDGTRLVFVRGRAEERRSLYVVDLAAGAAAPRRVPRVVVEGADDAPAWVGWPTWSPDGRTIAFSADRGEGLGTGLHLVAPDGTGLRRLTRPPATQRWIRDLRAVWSPDGARLAFASNRHAASEDDAGDLDLYDVDVAGGAVRRLTHDPGVADDPCYSPDGRRLYFSSTREPARDYAVELYVMASGGGEQRRLTRDEVPENSAPSCGSLPQ